MVSLSFGVGETNCSQGTTPRLSLLATILQNTWQATMDRLRWPKKKNGMTKHLKLIRRRWQNIPLSARSSLTGLKLTEKSKIRQSRTSQTSISRSSSTIRRTLTINCRCLKSRSSQTCISQVSYRNKAIELLFVGGGAFALGYAAFRFH